MTENQKPANPSDTNQILRLQKSETFSGPIPHPEIIERYEKVLPGAAERIFSNWEKQTEHRQKLEKQVVTADSIKALLGVVFGFIAVITTIGVGAWTAMQGHPLFGGSLSLAGLALLVAAFFTTRQNKQEEKEI